MIKILRKKLFKSVLWFSLVSLLFIISVPLYSKSNHKSTVKKDKNLSVSIERLKRGELPNTDVLKRLSEIESEMEGIERSFIKKDLPAPIFKRHKETTERFKERIKKARENISKGHYDRALREIEGIEGAKVPHSKRGRKRKKVEPRIKKLTREVKELNAETCPPDLQKELDYKLKQIPLDKIREKIKLTPEGERRFERWKKWKEGEKKEEDKKQGENSGAQHDAEYVGGTSLSRKSRLGNRSYSIYAYYQNSEYYTLNPNNNTLTDELFAYAGDISLIPFLLAAPPKEYPQYLVETPEVKFTDRIKDLADSLENNPGKIFDYVLNNINYEPYYGSLKGADETLLEKAGNDYDISSLLIALLRYSGYPARYVQGEMMIPIEWMSGVLGVDDNWMPSYIIGTNHIPGTQYTVNGEPYAMRLEWVWVETYIPWMGGKVYRGSFNSDNIGDAKWLWCSMDGAIKEYEEEEGLSLRDIGSFDAEELINAYQSSGTVGANGSITGMDTTIIGNEWNSHKGEFTNFLADSLGDPTLGQVAGVRKIKELHLGFIPGTLPFNVLEEKERWDEIPDNLRHKVRIVVSYWPLYLAQEPSLDLLEIDYKAPTCELSGKRITVSYRPATSNDRELVKAYGGKYKVVPAVYLHLFMQLKVDGEIRGDHLIDEISMGLSENLGIMFYTPWSPNRAVESLENIIKAGGHYAIVFDWQKMPAYYPLESGLKVCEASANSSKDEDAYMGEQLRNVGLTYLYQLDKSDEMYARTCGVVTSREPAECFVSFDPDIAYLADWIPYQVTGSKVRIDLDRDLMGVFPKDGDWNKRKQFFTASGITSSILEEAVLMELYRVPSLSAIQCLSKANDEGIPIYLVTPENIGSIDLSQIDADARQEIICYVTSQGYEAIVPERNVQISDWNGIGYVLRDTATQAGLYMISGGYGGGTFATPEEFIQSFLEQFISASSDIWTDLEGGTMPALDGITEVYGFFDQPSVQLLYQDNILANTLSLGPLFMMSSQSAAMTGTSSLSGFMGTMQWAVNQIMNLLHFKVVYFNFRRQHYYSGLERRKVRAFVRYIIAKPVAGVDVDFSVDLTEKATVTPSSAVTNSQGYAEVLFEGKDAFETGETVIITAKIEGFLRDMKQNCWLTAKDNSEITLEDVLQKDAVYIHDPEVESISDENPEDYSQRRFDYIQELLNQVVPRKFTLVDRGNNSTDYVFLDENGQYGDETQRAIELLRSSFHTVSWDESEVISKLKEDYENDFTDGEWLTKVVDRDLLVGSIYLNNNAMSQATRDLYDPYEDKNGVLELYENYVVPFIDKMIEEAEKYVNDTTRWRPRPEHDDNYRGAGNPRWVGTGEIIYEDEEADIVYRNTGVVYSFGAIDRLDQWRDKITGNLNPMIDPVAREYMGNKPPCYTSTEAWGDYNRDGFPGGHGIDDDNDGLTDEDSEGRQPGETGYTNDLEEDDDEDGTIDENDTEGQTKYPAEEWYEYGYGHQTGLKYNEQTQWGKYTCWDWAGIDCRGLVQRSIKSAGEKIRWFEEEYLVPDSIIPDLDIHYNYDIYSGHWTRQGLNDLYLHNPTPCRRDHSTNGNCYVVSTTSNNWYKRLKRGDLLHSNNHVVLVYSDPFYSTNEGIYILKIIHAFGEFKDLDADRRIDFTRKSIISRFYLWGYSSPASASLSRGRIRLWK